MQHTGLSPYLRRDLHTPCTAPGCSMGHLLQTGRRNTLLSVWAKTGWSGFQERQRMPGSGLRINFVSKCINCLYLTGYLLQNWSHLPTDLINFDTFAASHYFFQSLSPSPSFTPWQLSHPSPSVGTTQEKRRVLDVEEITSRLLLFTAFWSIFFKNHPNDVEIEEMNSSRAQSTGQRILTGVDRH